jgi:hypothetical protein
LRSLLKAASEEAFPTLQRRIQRGVAKGFAKGSISIEHVCTTAYC